MLRVVSDLNILVSALIEPRGPARAVVRAGLESKLGLVVCPRWIAQAHEVTARERLRRRFTLAEAEELVAGIEGVWELRPDPAEVPARGRDAADDHLIALALEAGCAV